MGGAFISAAERTSPGRWAPYDSLQAEEGTDAAETSTHATGPSGFSPPALRCRPRREGEELARERGVTALLVAHLAELDTRDVHLRAGFSSLFSYCREVLALSEHEAYNRIEVARAARRFPLVLELLAAGSVNLTTVRLLGPQLTPENHRSVLESAHGKRKAEVEEMVARLSPRPDVPASVRKLSRPKPESAPAENPGWTGAIPPVAAVRAAEAAEPAPPSLPLPRSERVAEVAPLSPDRYRLQVTIGGATLRAVWVRDLGRCAFVGTHGRRCGERAFLEFHHLRPYAVGGEATVDNLELRCRRHNDHEARVFLGRTPSDAGGAFVRETAAPYEGSGTLSGRGLELVPERVGGAASDRAVTPRHPARATCTTVSCP